MCKSCIKIGLNIIIVWLLQTMIVQGSEFPINAKAQLNKTGFLESKSSPIDSTHIPKKDSNYDSYGNLLKEDIFYFHKFPLWIPIAEIIEANFCQNLLDDYLFHLPFNKVGFKSWGQNLKSGFPWNKGWWWDENRFGNNFLYNPVNGSTYYNIARTNGYNFWESIPFVVGGSYMWKIFGGTEKPERADIINSTFDGIFLGEIMYRVSSNILDDRTTGAERVGREFLAFLVDPTRGINRIIHAQTWRVTQKEVYEKEPLSVSLSSGIRLANNGVNFGSGPANPIFNAKFDYGNPFDDRDWKPFDIFKFRAEFNFGVGRKIIDNLIGYGILTGTNRQYGNLEALYGLFLNYDYWDNKVFELGTSAITAGIMTRWNLSDKRNLYTNFHIGFVPLAGNSALLIPDTSQYRDYDFGTGMEGQFESTLNLGQHLSFTITDYFYLIHTFNAPQPEALSSEGQGIAQNIQYPVNGNNLTDIFCPRIAIKLIGNLKIGMEEVMYYTNIYTLNSEVIHRKESQQKIYLTFSIEDFHQHKS